ncbi:universal stress protein [Halococcus agarilyticus]|uniref:universal stress protein n=1 Tax=Halococcus agarilyticus TaxID=1232219 RepID=UPI0006780E4B|nr:universal stress protein [Halococcus agarilyticus]
MSERSSTMHVLVPIDGSPRSERALDHALGMADATITVLTVIDPLDVDPLAPGFQSPAGVPGMPGYSEEWYEGAKESAEELHAEARERAAEHDRSLTTEIVFGRPARRIVAYADDNDVDHVVIGNHSREEFPHVLLGNTAESVVRRSPVNVTVVR